MTLKGNNNPLDKVLNSTDKVSENTQAQNDASRTLSLASNRHEGELKQGEIKKPETKQAEIISLADKLTPRENLQISKASLEASHDNAKVLDRNNISSETVALGLQDGPLRSFMLRKENQNRPIQEVIAEVHSLLNSALKSTDTKLSLMKILQTANAGRF